MGVRVVFLFTDAVLAANDMTVAEVLEEFGPDNEDVKAMTADGVQITVEEYV